jgi:hypothetical protein
VDWGSSITGLTEIRQEVKDKTRNIFKNSTIAGMGQDEKIWDSNIQEPML